MKDLQIFFETEIYNKDNIQKVKRLIFSRLKSRLKFVRMEDVDDLAQNTFFNAWNKLAKFRGESSPKTWLYTIAEREILTFLLKGGYLKAALAQRAESLDALKESVRFEGGFDAEMQRKMCPYERLKRSEISKCYGTARALLKSSHAEMFEMRLDGAHHKEIAHALNTTEKTVQVTLFRVRGYLQSSMGGNYAGF